MSGIERLKDWFGEALEAAGIDLRLQDKEKGDSWRECNLKFLYNKMTRHIIKMGDQIFGSSQYAVDIHAIKAINYALMIATRVAMIKKEAEANG